MRNFGTVEIARLMQANDLPEAGLVKCYREELETVIAHNLQVLIRVGSKPQSKEQRDKRRSSIRRIIVECCRELDKEQVRGEAK